MFEISFTRIWESVACKQVAVTPWSVPPLYKVTEAPSDTVPVFEPLKTLVASEVKSQSIASSQEAKEE